MTSVASAAGWHMTKPMYVPNDSSLRRSRMMALTDVAGAVAVAGACRSTRTWFESRMGYEPP